MFSSIRRRRNSRRSRNLLTNSLCAGVGAGTPGTLPRGWASSFPDITHGVTTQVVGAVTENGIDCFDWRISGTPVAAVGNSNIFFNALTDINGIKGDAITTSAYVKLVSGTIPFFVGFEIFELLQNTGFIDVGNFSFTPTSSLMRYSASYVAIQATTALLAPCLTVGYNATFDITLRIGSPQSERGMALTSPERRLIV